MLNIYIYIYNIMFPTKVMHQLVFSSHSTIWIWLHLATPKYDL